QLEQEQFSMFEEMIRQQDRQRERQHTEFNTPARPKDDALLIPGIQGPPLPYLDTPRPITALHQLHHRPLTAHLSRGTSATTVRLDLKPHVSLCVSATLVDGLRQITVPAELCGKFLRLANNNTIRAVETCGILCGSLV
ncbi:hypothetical protein M9458_018110, partial [Cirrhinus mrigala]